MDTSPLTAQTVPERIAPSTFVTVLAWLFIVGAGLATFMSLFQAVVFTFVLPEAKFWSDPGPVRGLENLPPVAQFMLRSVTLFFVIGWAVFALTLIAAIALLRRKNWARLYFVSLMALGILWNMGGLWFQFSVLSSFPLPADAPADIAREFGAMRTVMGIGSTIFAVALTVLFAWIIKRLLSPSIRAEFNAL